MAQKTYKNELHYPKRCRKAKIEGRSFVRYTVEKDGRLTGFEIIKSSGNRLLDKEAMRVIKKMPKWKPGRVAGNKVRTSLTIPVEFRLEKKGEKSRIGFRK